MALPDFPEILLRHIWLAQAFSVERLATADGRAIRILTPGTPNTDAGPDFLNATLSIGSTTYTGDVELHINATEWLAHKHDTDAHYNRVILHVVLTADTLSPPARTRSNRPIPLLVLHQFLDEKMLDAWRRTLAADTGTTSRALPCSDINRNISAGIVTAWIEKLALERIELKVRRFEERLKQLVDEQRQVVREPYPRYYGNPADIPIPKNEYTKRDFSQRGLWEQMLYEGVMEALGYAKNSVPFLTLARSLRLDVLRKHSTTDSPTMMAMLFGVAGLLPDGENEADEEVRQYVTQLSMRWQELRKDFAGTLLHEADWLFFRLRPGNFPTARLAAMAFLLPRLFDGDAFLHLIAAFRNPALNNRERLQLLHSIFDFETDSFWKRHYHFAPSERKASRRRAALGRERIDDILINVICPIVLLYGRIFRNGVLVKNVRSLLAGIPVTQKSSIITTINEQVTRNKVTLDSSLYQQGALQLYRFFCAANRCPECRIGQHTTPPLSSSRRE